MVRYIVKLVQRIQQQRAHAPNTERDKEKERGTTENLDDGESAIQNNCNCNTNTFDCLSRGTIYVATQHENITQVAQAHRPILSPRRRSPDVYAGTERPPHMTIKFQFPDRIRILRNICIRVETALAAFTRSAQCQKRYIIGKSRIMITIKEETLPTSVELSESSHRFGYRSYTVGHTVYKFTCSMRHGETRAKPISVAVAEDAGMLPAHPRR